MNLLSAINSSAQHPIGTQSTANNGAECPTSGGSDRPFAKLLHQRQNESKTRLNADFTQQKSAQTGTSSGPAKIDPKEKAKPQLLPLKAAEPSPGGDTAEPALTTTLPKSKRAEDEPRDGAAMPPPPAPFTQPPATGHDSGKAPAKSASSANKVDAGRARLTSKPQTAAQPESRSEHDPAASFNMLMNIGANSAPQGPMAGPGDGALANQSGNRDLQPAANMPTILAGLSPAGGDLPTADLLKRIEAGAKGEGLRVGSIAEPGSLAGLSMPGAVSGNPDSEAPAVVTVSTPVQAPEFREALAAQVTLLTKAGIQEATLQLNPTDLGPIAIQISLEGTQARVDFTVSSPITRDIIESGMSDLANAMRHAGLTFTGGGVSQNNSGARRESEADTGRPNGRSTSLGDNLGAPSTPARTLSTRVGGLDLYA